MQYRKTFLALDIGYFMTVAIYVVVNISAELAASIFSTLLALNMFVRRVWEVK